MPKIPARSVDDELNDAADPWMTLGQVVRRAAWRGLPEPKWGSTIHSNGTWTDAGELGEVDRLIYLRGAREVRSALADGSLEAWGQVAYEEPILLPPSRWSIHSGKSVSWIDFAPDFSRVIVRRADVLSRWPASAEKIGRPAEYNWEWVYRRAREVLHSTPLIKRYSLAQSLVADYRRDFPVSAAKSETSMLRAFQRELEKWNLPPNA